MVLLKSFSTVSQNLVFFLSVTFTIFVAKYYFQKRRLFQLGSKLPGPKGWPLIGNPLKLSKFHLNMVATVNKCHKKYDLFAVWFGHYLNVFIKSPEDAEIYCNSTNLIHRGDKFDFIYPILGKGLLFASGSEWKKAKRIMDPAFPYAALKAYISQIQEEGYVFINRLKKEEGKSSFPVLPYLRDCTMDVITSVSCGLDDKKAQTGKLKIINEIESLFKLAVKKIFTPWQQVDFIYPYCPDGKKFHNILNYVMNFVEDEVNKARKIMEEEKRANTGVRHNRKEKRKKQFWQNIFLEEDLTIDEMKNHIFTMVVTAYHTTANLIAFVLVMLALHKDVEEETYQELISAVPDGVFDDEKLKKLKYFERVIKETLRLFPIVPINFRKATDNIILGPHTIPAGADVFLNISQLHRDPNQFENPNEFNPDNFLPENVAKRHPYSYIPFSAGHRKCIGDKYAFLVTKVIVGMILLNYKIECDYKSLEDIPTQGQITLKMTDECPIRLLKR